MSLPEMEGADPKASPQQDDQRPSDHSIQVHGTEDLEVIGNFADQVIEADHQADTGSLDAGRALKRLYDDRGWCAEWLLQKPIRKTGARGPEPKPDSQARFNAWLKWRLKQKDHKALDVRRTNQLILAAKTAEKLGNHGSQVSSERVIRPLNWLIAPNQQFGRFAPEVWRRAVDLAGSADQVTAEHTKKALVQWKKDIRPAGAIKEHVTTSKAERARGQAMQCIGELWNTTHHSASERDKAQWREFVEWFQSFSETGRW